MIFLLEGFPPRLVGTNHPWPPLQSIILQTKMTMKQKQNTQQTTIDNQKIIKISGDSVVGPDPLRVIFVLKSVFIETIPIHIKITRFYVKNY